MDNSTIKRLPLKVVNKIAAGEVITRPLNVVKELVENAIDAGSSKIEIVLERAGRNLIKVIDDGIGISKEDLPLVVERYATSKLKEENLFNIAFMGFRGEAMHSIASVAKLSIISRAKNADMAWKLICTESGEVKIFPAQLLNGTVVEVRDLFFFTPQKVAFLKDEGSEVGAISSFVRAISLMHPQISFLVSRDGRDIINYCSCSKVLQRIEQIKHFGQDAAENIMHGRFENDNYVIELFASKPTFNGNRKNFYIFVNGRLIKDNAIDASIRSAYYDYVPSNRFPTVIMFLLIPCEEVDVNVHPTKSEVSFANEEKVKKLVISSITKIIRQDKIVVSHTNDSNVVSNLDKAKNENQASINSNSYEFRSNHLGSNLGSKFSSSMLSNSMLDSASEVHKLKGMSFDH